MEALARWWDGVELWIAGLPFVPQALLVVAVMVPVCFGLASVLDRVLGATYNWLDSKRRRDSVASQGTSQGEGNL
ncbi:hypothetical protein IEU95_14540 [Hoyosella rhizosphaerae]|uniref:Uncharacterized protein n=1 Tax=Hoyosella rhizosphaerae TaxID=1755582 RepID=A0A916UGR7_9ACTN|nr:hypothetical protein [Hoyosella rhizosphaerae]MBN4928056.1 hypothetical protein [Hoyosella rhizosphaerae]GGC72063.1 hypothetical protein GCM10011410_26350 [Hoyosella rhizosphaerae]